MLRQLDEALEAMLRDRVPLATDEIDVAFEAPNTDWIAGLIRPTVNLFLWGVTPSDTQATAGMGVFEENGRRVRRPPHPRLRFSYFVTAWTNDVGDEHQLLGAVLAAVLKEATLDSSFLPEALAAAAPPVGVAMGREDSGRMTDFWSAIGGKLKVGFELLVSATMDASAVSAVGPPAVSYEVRVQDSTTEARRSSRRMVGGIARGVAAGTVVRTPRGTSTTDADGRFVVPAVPGDFLVVECQPARQVPVPDSGDIDVD
jgi:hypothetical protein